MTRKCGRLIKLSITVASSCFQTISHHRFLGEMRDAEMSTDREFLHDFSKTAEIHSDSRKNATWVFLSIPHTYIHWVPLTTRSFTTSTQLHQANLFAPKSSTATKLTDRRTDSN